MFLLFSSLILSRIVFPLSRQHFSYYPPVNKVVNREVHFGKKIKIILK